MPADMLNMLEANSILLISLVSLLGLFIGSFLNVVIYRLPLRLKDEWRTECREFLEVSETPAETSQAPGSIFTSRSHCPHCGHLIGALENIPVLSYLFLRGKCAECRASISPRYPLVEILTTILSGLAAWSFGYGIALPLVLLLIWTLIALSFIDFDHHLLPDKLLLLTLVYGPYRTPPRRVRLHPNLIAQFCTMTFSHTDDAVYEKETVP